LFFSIFLLLQLQLKKKNNNKHKKLIDLKWYMMVSVIK